MVMMRFVDDPYAFLLTQDILQFLQVQVLYVFSYNQRLLT